MIISRLLFKIIKKSFPKYQQGRGRIISHDFNDGIWRVGWKVIAKQ